MAKGKALSRADVQQWAAYSQTLDLLPGRARLALAETVSPRPAATPAMPGPGPSPPRYHPVIRLDTPPSGLDRATFQKFRKGQMPAERRLDLHGLSAARAHAVTAALIHRAYAEHLRCVEIITGKGEVLARELPLWLNAAELRPYILALAHPHAANTGAVRVLLRRLR